MLESGGHDDERGTPPEAAGSRRVRFEGVGILDLILILLERKWFLALGMAIISGGSVALVLLMTSYYTAATVVLPSKQGSGMPFGSMLGDLPMSGLMKSLDIFGQGDNSRFLSILDSRRLADNVIGKFDLIHRYEFDKKKYYYESVLKEYHANVKVGEDELDNIKISVTDSNPQTAADMANYIVDQLDSISYQISQESARGSRMFFEQRLAVMRIKLDSVHHAFADFQIEHNFIDLDQQVKSSIEALAGIEAEAMATDIEKEMLSSSFGDNSRMAEVKKKKEVLNRRMEEYMKKGSGSLVLPLRKTPELAIQYQYLYRDIKVNEGLYAFLLQMYEQAKFKEANNSPVVTVLERAKTPQKRSQPKRMVLCIVIFLAGFTLLGTWVLLSHWYGVHRSRQTETYFKLRKVFAHFGRSR